jgi:AcrR family transcriptional regulator
MSPDSSPTAADAPPVVAQGPRGADGRKHTQRERILGAVVEIAARGGYSAATISRIITNAGVSRPTFYDYFTDQEECFLQATIAGNEQLVAYVTSAVGSAENGSGSASAIYAAVPALIEFARSQPSLARVLVDASLAAGSRAFDERDNAIATLAEIVDLTNRSMATDSSVPDVASDVLLGAIYRLLGSRMRQDRPLDAELLADVIAWIESYEVPANIRRWETLRTPTFGGASDAGREPPFGAAPVANRPRARARNLETYRQRLFFATSELVKEKGFGATTIAEITSRARVGYRSFSHLFGTKERAFLAMYDLGYRRVFATTAGAYFSRETWPERVWAAGDAYTRYLGRHPTIAHFGFVETYSAGSRAATQTDTAIKAFTIFLQEGHTHTPAGIHRPSSLALDAIAATIFDIAAHETRTGDSTSMPALLPQAVFVALAPFLGPRAAIQFIDRKLAEEAGTPRSVARSGS